MDFEKIQQIAFGLDYGDRISSETILEIIGYDPATEYKQFVFDRLKLRDLLLAQCPNFLIKQVNDDLVVLRPDEMPGYIQRRYEANKRGMLKASKSESRINLALLSHDAKKELTHQSERRSREIQALFASSRTEYRRIG